VEADLDGKGFQVFDPTPAAGVPPLLRPYSLVSRLFALGREIEFFYDRRVLGFDAGDQAGVVDLARDSVGAMAGRMADLRDTLRDALSPGTAAGLLAAGLAGALLLRLFGRRERRSPATRAYLALRRLTARRGGILRPATAPAEVARRFARQVP